MNKIAFPPVEEPLMHSLAPLFFLGLTASSALVKPAAAQTASNRAKFQNVLVLGDSISAGYGLKRAEAYPALLVAKAAAAGEPIHLSNAGLSGETSAGGLRRLPHLLRQPVDVLLIQLGINDAFRGVPVPQIEANLQKIIDLTRAHSPGVRIVLAGMQLPNHSESDYLREFGEMYVELARRNRAELIPFLLEGVLGNPNLNQPDLIHPNASGQKIIAANVWPVLERVLRGNGL